MKSHRTELNKAKQFAIIPTVGITKKAICEYLKGENNVR